MAIRPDSIAEHAAKSQHVTNGRARVEEAHAGAAVPERHVLRIKDVLDRILAAFGLLLSLPLLALLCALIKLTSRGPAFHSQDRVGKDGKLFRILKLRTMVENAEQATGPVWASENDPRVTPIGRLLRKSHLDELPQLWNVLQGHMSLVGPRPERPMFVEQFDQLIPRYRERLRIKPGITGLAQVNHRYDATIHDVRTKLAYDLRYIKHLSLRTDFLIALATLRCLIGGQSHWPPRTSAPPSTNELLPFRTAARGTDVPVMSRRAATHDASVARCSAFTCNSEPFVAPRTVSRAGDHQGTRDARAGCRAEDQPQALRAAPERGRGALGPAG